MTVGGRPVVGERLVALLVEAMQRRVGDSLLQNHTQDAVRDLPHRREREGIPLCATPSTRLGQLRPGCRFHYHSVL